MRTHGARYVNENISKVLKVDSSLLQHVRVVVLGAKKKRAFIRVLWISSTLNWGWGGGRPPRFHHKGALRRCAHVKLQIQWMSVMSEWMSEGQWDGKKEGERTRGSQSQQLHLSHTALWIPAVGLSLLTCALYCRTKIKPAQNTSDSSTAERASWCKCTAGTWSFRWLVSLKIKKELSNSVTNTHSSSWLMYEIRAAFCMTHSVLTVLARQIIINVIMYPCTKHWWVCWLSGPV